MRVAPAHGPGKEQVERLTREDAALLARNRAISQQVRNADVKVAANTPAILPQPKRPVPPASLRPGRASATPSAAGGPAAADILRAHALAFTRHSAGSTTGTPGEVAIPNPLGGGTMTFDRRTLSNLRCAKAGSGLYRCSYGMAVETVAAPGSSWGTLVAGLQNFGAAFRGAMSSPNYWTYTFKAVPGGWYSAELDKSMRDAANASRSAPTPSNEPSLQDRWRQNRTCLSDAMLNGTPAVCPY